LLVVFDINIQQNIADVQEVVDACRGAGICEPVFAVNFVSACPDVHQAKWGIERLFKAEIEFVTKVDSSLSDSVEMALMRRMVEGQRQRKRINEAEEELAGVRDHSEYLLWKWIPRHLRVQIPPIDHGHINNQFQFDGTLGKGAFGLVQKATTPDGQIKAVKVFRKDNAQSIIDAERIYREIQILQMLPPHPNLAKLENVVHYRDAIYMCLSYGGPQNLYRLQSHQPDRTFTVEISQQIFGQLASGIGHMHANMLFHRDVKPENIVVSGDIATPVSQSIKTTLVDFGMAVTTQTPLRQPCGSLPFAAPEILDDPCRYFGGQVDAFAVGMVLFEIVRGQRSMEKLLGWDSETQPATYRAQELRTLLANGPPTTNRSPGEPDAVQQLLAGLLEINPSDRMELVEVMRSPWLSSVPNVGAAGAAMERLQ
jgi:serine/threonine protein kinase